MTPFDWIKWAPWIMVAVLVAALTGMTNLYLGQRDARIKLETSVKVIGDKAKANLVLKEKEGKDNLETLRKDNENIIPKIRNDAVANYVATHPAARVRNPVACRSPVRKDGTGKQVDDGAQQKPVPDATSIGAGGSESTLLGELIVDDLTIQECAVDAKKNEAWQQYCTLNHCPIE